MVARWTVDLPPTPQRTTPGFAFSIVERSLFDCIAVRQFGKVEMEAAIDFFGSPACVYCGSAPVERWDHLVPISKGGDTVLGNIVPACSRCDDSKRDLSLEEWARTDSPGSLRARGIADIEARLTRIAGYVSKYRYVPRMPDDRLTADELRKFELMRRDMAQLRKDFDDFLAIYRDRARLR